MSRPEKKKKHKNKKKIERKKRQEERDEQITNNNHDYNDNIILGVVLLLYYYVVEVEERRITERGNIDPVVRCTISILAQLNFPAATKSACRIAIRLAISSDLLLTLACLSLLTPPPRSHGALLPLYRAVIFKMLQLPDDAVVIV